MNDQIEREERIARQVNVVLAAWLLILAFAWRHDGLPLVLVALVGALVVAYAPRALGPARVRSFNGAAGIALAAAALTLPRHPSAMAWNSVLVGLAITTLSLLPASGGFHAPHPLRAWRARHPRRGTNRR
jgi:hypothetical protein